MSMYPRLLHPVLVTLEQSSISNTLYDEDAREPMQQSAYSTPVTIQGQVQYGSSREQSFRFGGIREEESGYVLFRKLDLDGNSITLKINDRITNIGNIEHDCYITRLEPLGHYSAFGNTMVKAYFSDRQPGKHR